MEKSTTMKESCRFSLATATGEGSSEILVEGRPTNLRIEGRILEAQYELEAGGRALHVLFVTDGTPYEEILHIYLTDAEGRVVEQTELGGAYAPGILTDVGPVSERELRFAFQGQHRLVLRDEAQGYFRPRLIELSKLSDNVEPSR